ncbi:MAG: hypothetical protein EPN73_03525 [Paraburkholderia sp.]|uniref:hypothetical protein n=1 Tax=Paraburkholderia sp. TaxID=1926495 RepID=UPI00120BDB66|nr:hypothetical protein [Paraburkholderia sp.]TAL98284.1 MAG: hypothetical protein EPN73_03525 [Paraburkholderia sp.]
MQRIDAHQHYSVLRVAARYGGYGEWLSTCEDDCERLFGAVALPDVFGGNACRFYRIGVMTRRT